MRVLFLSALAPLLSWLTACSALRPAGPPPVSEPPLRAAPAVVKTYQPAQRITIRSRADIPRGVGRVYREGRQLVWDGQHRWRLDGGLLRGNCDQAESQEALLEVRMPRFTLKNFRIHESKNGLAFKGDHSRIIGCVFEKICEDAINPKDCAGGLVERCDFAHAEDKVIQLNRCAGWIIRDNIFRQARNAVRAMGSEVVLAEGNRFYNVDTAYHSTRPTGFIHVQADTDLYAGVKTRYKTEGDGAVIRVAGSAHAGTP